MSEKFNARYRVQTVRMPNWDYGWKGDYFVTVKTWNRIHFFGEIIDGEMHLNEIGQILDSEWDKTPLLRPDMNITLGEFIVMPNHFHGIISIGRNPYNQYDGGDDGCDCDDCRAMHPGGRGDAMHPGGRGDAMHPGGRGDAMHPGGRGDAMHPGGRGDAMHRVSTTGASQKQFGPQSKNLASIIRGLKSSVTIQGRRINPDFKWQPGFHEHLIRDADAYNRIAKYIRENVQNWNE
jgi:REP element-mobilizing transposase RayT